MNELRELAGDVDRALSRLADAVEAYTEAASEKRKRLVGKPDRVNDLSFVANSASFLRDAVREHEPLAKLIGWNWRRSAQTFAGRHPAEKQ